jgi:hypothetical protein
MLILTSGLLIYISRATENVKSEAKMAARAIDIQ